MFRVICQKKLWLIGINFFFKTFTLFFPFLNAKKTRQLMNILSIGAFFSKISAKYAHLIFFLKIKKKVEVGIFFQVGRVTGSINLFFVLSPGAKFVTCVPEKPILAKYRNSELNAVLY